MAFLIASETRDLTGVTFFLQFFFRAIDSIVASGQNVIPFFLFSKFLLFILPVFFVFSKGSVALVHAKVDFKSLALGFLGQGSLLVISWICIFRAVLLKKQ